MLSKTQWGMIAFLVGLPIVWCIALMLLSPSYMNQLFIPNDLPHGFVILSLLSVVNFVFLLVILSRQNRRETERKHDEMIGFAWGRMLPYLASFVLFTLPALSVILLYPALIDLSLVEDTAGLTQHTVSAIPAFF